MVLKYIKEYLQHKTRTMASFSNPYIVKFTTVQANSIKTLFDSLKDILNDVNLFFTPEGIKMQAMDGAHTALVFLKLDKDNFELYECTKDKVVAGINMTSISKLIKTVAQTDTITMSMVSEDKLTITITNVQKNTVSTSVLNLLDIDEDTYEIPNIKYDSIIQMASTDFQKICRDLSNIGDVVKIKSENNVLELNVDGDFASQSITIGDSSAGMSGMTQTSSTDSLVEEKFSLKYLNMFTKSSNLSQNIEMYLKKDKPMILVYKVGNLGRIQYALAPKADDI